jgi:hypothetical protein
MYNVVTIMLLQSLKNPIIGTSTPQSPNWERGCLQIVCLDIDCNSKNVYFYFYSKINSNFDYGLEIQFFKRTHTLNSSIR